MKRLCLILAYLFLFSQTASAMPLLVGQKVVYRGTITGLRISAVDGTAFIDNAGATIPTYADGNHQIEIYDSSNRMLKGVLKAAGSSETLGDELITVEDDRTFASDTGWWIKTGTGWSITGGVAVHAGTVSGGIRHNDLWGSVGRLCKLVVDVGVANVTLFSFNTSAGSTLTPGTNTLYGTVGGVNLVFLTTGDGATMDNVSIKQVIAPSSSGCTIVSAKGGTTYNFSYKNASFKYNASSYYVIIRAIR